jgi:small-conductance mechanosensitive channel
MFSDFLTQETLLLIAAGLVIVIVVLVADRLVRRAISRYSKRLKLEPHVENIFKLTARIIIFAVGVIAFLSLFGMPTEWFIGVSALTGAAIGFASTQTVGNFLAGLYIMMSRPFIENIYAYLQHHGNTKQKSLRQHHPQLLWQKKHNRLFLPNGLSSSGKRDK